MSEAAIQSYDQLRQAVARRRKALGLTQLDLDDLAGVQDGYTGKLECGARHFGPLSLGLILQALGVELVLQPVRHDPPQPKERSMSANEKSTNAFGGQMQARADKAAAMLGGRTASFEQIMAARHQAIRANIVSDGRDKDGRLPPAKSR